MSTARPQRKSLRQPKKAPGLHLFFFLLKENPKFLFGCLSRLHSRFLSGRLLLLSDAE